MSATLIAVIVFDVLGMTFFISGAVSKRAREFYARLLERKE
jgi:hypothetical protein